MKVVGNDRKKARLPDSKLAPQDFLQDQALFDSQFFCFVYVLIRNALFKFRYDQENCILGQRGYGPQSENYLPCILFAL